MYENIDFDQIDLSGPAPEQEPERQYYFMAIARELVRRQSEKLGRPLTACTTTFGCQMNARDSESWKGSLRRSAIRRVTVRMPTSSSIIPVPCGKTRI